MRFIEAIKKLVKYAIYGDKCSSDRYIKALRKKGCTIGNHTTIYAPQHTIIDVTRPFAIEIGDNVEITAGCMILTHGYDWSVLKGVYGDVLGSFGKVHIGNNVFIGVNTTILKGSYIGNNVIIGANTLVNGVVPDNAVVVGNPMRVVSTVSEYYEKRMSLQLKEAVALYHSYCDRYHVTTPPQEIFREFFWLFETEMDGDKIKNACFHEVMELGGTASQSYKAYKEREKRFASYDAFAEYCRAH